MFRPHGAAKQMEKIAVTQGPVALRVHLFQGPAQETASCGGRVRSWKEPFSCPANLTPLLRMNQKRNTSVEQKESEGGKESERKSETSCLDVPHLYNGAAAHARNRVQVWPQSNAQFAFTGISEMFRQGRFFFLFFFSGRGFELGCPLVFVPFKYIWGVVSADNEGPPS